MTFTSKILNESLCGSAAAKVALNHFENRPCFSSFQKKLNEFNTIFVMTAHCILENLRIEKVNRTVGNCQIPNFIPLASANPFVLSPPIGEVDDPENQAKHLLTLPLTEKGNAVIYGSAGSGKSALISTALVSSMEALDDAHLNAYVIDLGAETLTAFRDAPQVLDVITSADVEKAEVLIKVLKREVAERREVFAGKATSLEDLQKRCGVELPHIVVVINNISVLFETFPSIENDLFVLFRESSRYGIHFIVACNAFGDLRVKMLGSFKNVLTLSLSDESQYANVFGSFRGLAIPQGMGRGVYKTNNKLYEFQTAFVEENAGDDFYAEIESFASSLSPTSASSDTTKGVPTLPEVLSFEDVKDVTFSRVSLPVGVSIETYESRSLDIDERNFILVAGERLLNYVSYFRALAICDAKSNDVEILCIDTEGVLSEAPTEDQIEKLSELLDKGYVKKSKQVTYFVLIPNFTAVQTAAQEGKLGEIEHDQLTSIFVNKSRFSNCFFIVGFPSTATASLANSAWGNAILSSKEYLWVGAKVNMQYNLPVNTANFDSNVMKAGTGGGYVLERGKAEMVKFFVEE